MINVKVKSISLMILIVSDESTPPKYHIEFRGLFDPLLDISLQTHEFSSFKYAFDLFMSQCVNK